MTCQCNQTVMHRVAEAAKSRHGGGAPVLRDVLVARRACIVDAVHVCMRATTLLTA